MDKISERCLFVKKLILDVGKYQLSHFRTNIKKREKCRNDFITEVDENSNDMIIKEITSKFPKDSIYSEESPFQIGGSRFTWLIDPVDGTHMYMSGLPMWGVCVSLMYEYEIVAGFAYLPYLNEFFYGIKNQGAFLNDKKIFIGQEKTLDQTFVLLHSKFLRNTDMSIIKEVMDLTARNRCLGVSSIEMVYTAAGFVDAYIGYSLPIHDISAGLIIINEAGGVVKDWGFNDIVLDIGSKYNIVCGRVENVQKICKSIFLSN